MASLGTLAVNIVARTDKFVRGVTKSLSVVQKFSGGVAAAAKKVVKFSAALGAVGVAAGAAFTRIEMSAIDALGKTSDKLGIATEKLVAFRLAAEETGVGASTMEMALQRMIRRVAEAAQGMGEAQGALREMGLSPRFLASLAPDRQLLLIAEAMEKVERQNDRVRLAMKLFDSEGVSMVNMLKLGRKGLLDTEVAANKLGLTISRDMAAAVERANDAVGRLFGAFRGMFRQLVVRFSPLIEKAAKKLTDLLTGPGVARMADRFARFFVEATHKVLRAVAQLRVSVRHLAADLMEAAAAMQFRQSAQDSLMARAVKMRDSAQAVGMAGYSAADTFRGTAMRMLDNWMHQLERSSDAAEKAAATAAQVTRLPTQVQDLFTTVGRLIGKGNNLIPSAAKGLGAAAGSLLSGGLLGNHGGLRFAESGSAESFRQRAAIRRQSDDTRQIRKVADNTGDTADAVDQMLQLMQRGVALVPAGVWGGR